MNVRSPCMEAALCTQLTYRRVGGGGEPPPASAHVDTQNLTHGHTGLPTSKSPCLYFEDRPNDFAGLTGPTPGLSRKS